MYDFCINGGGMVGAALALGLAQKGYNVALIESTMPATFERESTPDLRVSAISQASVTLLDSLGAWQHIALMRVKPYKGLSVWEQPQHRTDFTCDSIGVPQLGYFVENRLIQLGCYKALASYDNVTWFTGLSLKGISIDSNASSVTLRCNKTNDEKQINARWLVAADGANSVVRQSAGIGTSGWQYAQYAMGINVEMTKPFDPVTWQQFTPSGPKAFLPLFGRYASLIWYDEKPVLNGLLGLSNDQLKAQIVHAFPKELTKNNNDFTVIDKAMFPLTRSHASTYVRDSVILIGDAAHTINPLAGQGVNLGFRDVAALLNTVSRCGDIHSASFESELVTHYEQPRRKDNLVMMSAMDGFYSLFSNQIGPISFVRNNLLSMIQKATPIKQRVLEYAIGVHEWKS